MFRLERADREIFRKGRKWFRSRIDVISGRGHHDVEPHKDAGEYNGRVAARHGSHGVTDLITSGSYQGN